MLSEKQKKMKQRDRVNTGYGMSRHNKETRDRRRMERDDEIRRIKPRRESRFDDRHSGRPDRRSDRWMNHGDDCGIVIS